MAAKAWPQIVCTQANPYFSIYEQLQRTTQSLKQNGIEWTRLNPPTSILEQMQLTIRNMKLNGIDRAANKMSPFDSLQFPSASTTASSCKPSLPLHPLSIAHRALTAGSELTRITDVAAEVLEAAELVLTSGEVGKEDAARSQETFSKEVASEAEQPCTEEARVLEPPGDPEGSALAVGNDLPGNIRQVASEEVPTEMQAPADFGQASSAGPAGEPEPVHEIPGGISEQDTAAPNKKAAPHQRMNTACTVVEALQVLPLGSEDVEHLVNMPYKTLRTLVRCTPEPLSLVKMIKAVHFDKKHPANHNVKWIDKETAKVFRRHQKTLRIGWFNDSTTEAVTCLITTGIVHFYGIAEVLEENMKKSKYEELCQYLDNLDTAVAMITGSALPGESDVDPCVADDLQDLFGMVTALLEKEGTEWSGVQQT